MQNIVIIVTCATVLTLLYLLSIRRQKRIDRFNDFMYTQKHKEFFQGKNKQLYVNEKGRLTDESFSNEILNNQQ